MRILVCGGRDYLNYLEFDDAMWKVYKRLGEPELTIIQGGQTGADFLAKCWAHMNGFPCIEVRADWKRFGKAAGPIRNKTMLEDYKPDYVVCHRGNRGTADMVRQAKELGVEVLRAKR